MLSFLTNAVFCISYGFHHELGLTPSPTCPPGKVVFAKAGCGRSGNKRDFSHASALLAKPMEGFVFSGSAHFGDPSLGSRLRQGAIVFVNHAKPAELLMFK